MLVKKTSKTTKGSKALKTMAVECVLATSRQNNRISAHRKRIAKRQGKKKAQMASAHLIITIAYNILKTGEPYQELGTEYVHQALQNKELKMIEYLKKKGYTIEQSDQQTA
ncbi:hypothetical protein P9E76_21310 [Schinkia azotoformans]|uniref:hypothetical protein n=1 Tax=Schinkia azotoformans TaxID=1454 RepID=UPI001F459DB3|nr:hypothetical protein [Schinkia azotoformans]MEC1639989.1 hypothetical protein [Schinkia azotoformans]MEC1947533.1 hypothetical protein [Schinkia azotoformans]